MLDITSLDSVRGNNVTLYAIKKLITDGTYPKFSILAGYMGVGKSTVARLVSEAINQSEFGVTVFNCGLDIDMKKVEEQVFKMNPATPRAFVFEEIHDLDKSQQTALLTMLDHQPTNVYIVCTTTEIYKILRTIRSRAQVFEFKLLQDRQLQSLLEDYLKDKGVELTKEAQQALIRSCHGVPRDLLKNTDLAIAGQFTNEQLNELMGQVSDDLMFTLFTSIKTSSIDFATNILPLLGEDTKTKLQQIRDFYTRFLLERHVSHNRTLDRDKVKTLEEMFSYEDMRKIGMTLVRATPDTLLLELSILNMELCGVSKKAFVGQQIDRVAVNQMQSSAKYSTDEVKNRINNARINSATIQTVKFGEEG